MLDSEKLQEVRRYLQQKLAAGELEFLRTDTPGHDPRGSSARNAAPAPEAAPDAKPGVRARPTAAAGDSLERIASEVAVCTRCRLHERRTHAVPGVGAADADLVFIGEGPGADEDAQGKPFVGRAGQLLTKIIAAIQLSREEVFITNIVKCRPPGNRDPEPDEIAACEPYLKRQLAVLQPKVICTLGRHAGATLTGRVQSMSVLRQGEHAYEGIRVFPTYHPAALLRNPQWKRPVWEDIQNVRRQYDARRENS